MTVLQSSSHLTVQGLQQTYNLLICKPYVYCQKINFAYTDCIIPVSAPLSISMTPESHSSTLLHSEPNPGVTCLLPSFVWCHFRLRSRHRHRCTCTLECFIKTAVTLTPQKRKRELQTAGRLVMPAMPSGIFLLIPTHR